MLGSKRFRQTVAQLQLTQRVDYAGVAALRRSVVELLAESFFREPSARRAEFEAFLGARPAVKDYAEFVATIETIGNSWRKWEPRMRYGKLQPGDYSESARRYHLYVQWVAEEQFGRLSRAMGEKGLQLYLDLPLGTHPDGYDAWRNRDSFAENVRAGAPPDPCFTLGQDWGFEPLHPQHIRELRYSYPIEFLRFQMRQTGMLRIDHVMGLHRMYWIPPGFPPSAGAYVSYPAEELHAILALESHRHRTMLVGENLGTVPPEVNGAMTAHDVREMYVTQYEQRQDPKRALRIPRLKSVASLNTHDMPTFTGHWKGLDIEERSQLGLIAPEAVPEERRVRIRLKCALVRFLQREGWLEGAKYDSDIVLQACLQWLAAGPAEVVLVTLEDLWGEEEPQNVPGTCSPMNWTRKTRQSLEQILASQDLRRLLSRFHKTRSKSR